MVRALGLSNRRLPSGEFASGNQQYLLETGQFLRTAEDVRNVVAGVANDKPIFVRDVAQVTDGGEEPSQYVRFSEWERLLSGGDDRRFQAQGNQRRHRGRRRPAPPGAAARQP